MRIQIAIAAGLAVPGRAGCAGKTVEAEVPTNEILLLGDGIGMTTMTAARSYAVGEEDELTTLSNPLIVVTADRDHTMTFKVYRKRGNPILDITRTYKDGQPSKDADGDSGTTPVVGNGPNRPNLRTNLDRATVLDDNSRQESGVHLASETHGGGAKLYAKARATIPRCSACTSLRSDSGMLISIRYAQCYGIAALVCGTAMLAVPASTCAQPTQKTAVSAATEGPELDLAVAYYSRVLTPEGVLRASRYEEKILRRSGHVWVARTRPRSAADQHAHQHFNHLVLPRHMTLDVDRVGGICRCA